METLYHLIEQYGLLIVFFNVLVEQLGAPVPAYPTLINEASAALVARQLMQRGYKKVRPLIGGIDAWRAAGYAIDV